MQHRNRSELASSYAMTKRQTPSDLQAAPTGIGPIVTCTAAPRLHAHAQRKYSSNHGVGLGRFPSAAATAAGHIRRLAPRVAGHFVPLLLVPAVAAGGSPFATAAAATDQGSFGRGGWRPRARALEVDDGLGVELRRVLAHELVEGEHHRQIGGDEPDVHFQAMPGLMFQPSARRERE